MTIDVGNAVGAIGALGLASFALVDATKLFRGGVSNSGFGFIKDAVKQFFPKQTKNAGEKSHKPPAQSIIEILYANWINGSVLGDQKAIAKSLIKLKLSEQTAHQFAETTEVDEAVLRQVAQKMTKGIDLSPEEANALGRFDLALTAILDEAYNRADQKYRNFARVAATAVAVVLAVFGGWAINDPSAPKYLGSQQMWLAALCGVLATPLAPIAKDLASALSAGVKVAESLKGR